MVYKSLTYMLSYACAVSVMHQNNFWISMQDIVVRNLASIIHKNHPIILEYSPIFSSTIIPKSCQHNRDMPSCVSNFHCQNKVPYTLNLCRRGTIIFWLKIKDKILQLVLRCGIIRGCITYFNLPLWTIS